MAGAAKKDEEVMSEINVTPFVDIVLVLLIILMVTSTSIVKASLAVELPKAASGGAVVESTLNVVLTKDGQMLVDGEVKTNEELVAKVKAEKANNPKLQAVIAADKGVPYGSVVHVIDLVKTNGVTSFALNIERVPTPEEGP
ncbi:MAG: biopolymer transporter ExbD [Deltaproteobacteria bacterium]|jgi:biopolymer transport protein ExbD|nr:biopolymer transporter ExbD [Deltaproteobacteria bacterium]